MDSNCKNPISDTEQRKATSPDILSSEDNKKEQEIQYQKTEGKIVPGDSSLVRAAESSNATDNERGLDAASNADSLSSTVSATGNEAPCLGKEVGASSESPSPRTSPENVCDSSKGEKQASKCVVSSQPPLTSAEAVESEKGKEAEQNVATSTQTVPPTCVIQNRETGEKEVEPCIARDNSPFGGAVKLVDSLRELADKIQLMIDTTDTASDSPKSRVSSLKALALQEIVSPRRRSAYCIKETDVKNKKETLPVTTSLKPPVLRAEFGDSSSSENREAQTENTALLTTREPEAGGNCEDDERKAFFYMSSCSVPGMGEGSEWPSVSAGYRMPSEQPGRRIVRQRSQEHGSGVCTQRCHYIVVAIALLTTITGCITYHLSDSGILPEVLRPIGASTAFVSFALCVFSAVYINYLSDHTHLPILPNYELLGDVDSVMALNRASNPEFYYSDDGHYLSRTSDYCLRETQSADAIDRRGYRRRSIESLQGDVKRCSDEAGTSYSTRPPKKFKAGSPVATENASELAQDAAAERVTALTPCSSRDKVETNGCTTQRSSHASDEIPSASQSCDKDSESDTSPLLPKKDR